MDFLHILDTCIHNLLMNKLGFLVFSLLFSRTYDMIWHKRAQCSNHLSSAWTIYSLVFFLSNYFYVDNKMINDNKLFYVISAELY